MEADSINVEKYVKEIAALVIDLLKASGRIFEQEHLRMINMASAINLGGSGGARGIKVTAKEIMEHKVMMNLHMVNVDTSLFRQWHQRFITTLSQVERTREEIIKQLVRGTDLGRVLDKVVENLKTIAGRSSREFPEMSGSSCWTKR